MRDEKQCPDCAELVLAQARVCRFCGYRFDGFRMPAALQALRPPARAARLPQLIRGWGVELPADEDVTFFGYCRLDSADGYLLVTARRLMFFAASGGRKLLEWPLEQVAGVAVAGRWGRSWLHLRGPGPDVALHHFANRHALAELAGHLRAPVSPS
jgi:hypothetical protein